MSVEKSISASHMMVQYTQNKQRNKKVGQLMLGVFTDNKLIQMIYLEDVEQQRNSTY